MYLVLHSYELIMAFWIAIWIFSLGDLWIAAATGFTQHLLGDQVTNPVKVMAYFYTYRMARGFRTDRIVDMEELKRRKKERS